MHLCRSGKALALLSGLCLVCAFFSILLHQEKEYHDYTATANIYQETQLFYLKTGDGETVKPLLDAIISSPDLPPVGLVTVSDDQVSGIDWDGEWKPNGWYALYGRFFNAEEMASAAKVAMLRGDFIDQLPFETMDTLWENGIEMGGEAIAVMGVTPDEGLFSEESYVLFAAPNAITLPLHTYFELGFQANRLRIVFTQGVTPAQIALLEQMAGSLAAAESYRLPKANNKTALRLYMRSTLQAGLILFLSLMSITGILLYWLRQELPRYRIYRICGASPAQILFFVSFNVFLLISLCFACAALLAHAVAVFMPVEVFQALPAGSYAALFLGALGYGLIVVNARALPPVLHGRVTGL